MLIALHCRHIYRSRACYAVKLVVNKNYATLTATVSNKRIIRSVRVLKTILRSCQNCSIVSLIYTHCVLLALACCCIARWEGCINGKRRGCHIEYQVGIVWLKCLQCLDALREEVVTNTHALCRHLHTCNLQSCILTTLLCCKELNLRDCALDTKRDSLSQECMTIMVCTIYYILGHSRSVTRYIQIQRGATCIKHWQTCRYINKGEVHTL